MTTTTGVRQAPPTEAEIRAVLEYFRVDDPIGQHALRLDLLYDIEDMRPSELARFSALVSAATEPIRKRTWRKLNAALTAAALQFAAEHPDAPRRAKPDVRVYDGAREATQVALAMRADYPDARPHDIDDGYGGEYWTVVVDRDDVPAPRFVRPDGSIR